MIKEKIHSFRPHIFDTSVEEENKKYKKLLRSNLELHIVDDFDEQLREYYAITHIDSISLDDFKKKCEAYVASMNGEKSPLGRWVYYPWIGVVVRILEEKAFYIVRTARNRELVSTEEQKLFYNAKIGIAGLSVGYGIVETLGLMGGANTLRLADHDVLALSNLNRVSAGVTQLGVPKVYVAARRMYELNPYATVTIFSEGINKKNVERFCNGGDILDMVIDEVDEMSVKYLLREMARKYKIPVVMAADVGERSVVDVERHDVQKTPFFNGRLGDVQYEDLTDLSKEETGKLIVKLVGAENLSGRLSSSMEEIGKTIVSWPQLGGTVNVNSAVVSYLVRKIICQENIESGRRIISLDTDEL